MRYLNLLLVFIPVTLTARYLNAGDTWIFMGACLAIIPLAVIIADATEQIAT